MMKDIFKNKGYVIGCIVGVAIVVVITIVLVGKSLNTSGANNNPNYGIIKTANGTTYPCLFKADAAVTKVGNQQFNFVVSTNESLDWGVLRKDNGVRRLSFSGLESGTSQNHLFMISYMPDGSSINNNLTTTYQVCDKNNNTVQSSFLDDVNTNPIYSDPGSGGSLSSETEVYSTFLPNVAGVYRIDGLAYYNGHWVLVTKMENLEIF